MYKVLCGSILAVVLTSLCGCSPSADTLVQRRIDQLNELADAMESGAEKAKLEELGERVQETTKAVEALELSDAEKKRLAKKYGTQAAKAAARVAKAGMSELQDKMKGMISKMPAMPKGMPSLP